MKKRILAALMAAAMVVTLGACGNADPGANAGGSTQGASASNSGEADGKKYKIGICQLVQHEALDAAT